MSNEQATRDAQLIAEALTVAGFDPVPAVGQVWHHHTYDDVLPDGQRRLVRITSIGNTVTGWQCRVRAWIDPVQSEDPDWWGFLYIKTLSAEYALIEESR